MPHAFPTEHVLGYCYDNIGKSYLFGAAGPAAFDCSGLAKAAWAPFANLPHNTVEQLHVCKPLAASHLQLEVGDLVFYYDAVSPSHVAVFVGYDVGGRALVIQATGELANGTMEGVVVIPIDAYAKHVAIARPPYVGWNHPVPS